MAKKLALNNSVGILGEDIATRFLQNQGFLILFRNYLKKWGEIDIVAKKGKKIYFIEVKAVSCENISRVTPMVNPAENIHKRKLGRMRRAIQSYLLEEKWEYEWQVDALLVYLDLKNREARVETVEHIIV